MLTGVTREALESPGTTKRLVLIGAGNAHLLVLKKWAMQPLKEVECLLVTERPTVLYSGMVPGLLAGEYRREEVEIDLVRICRNIGVSLWIDRVVGVTSHKVLFDSRPSVVADCISINVGSKPKPIEDIGLVPLHIPLKPLNDFIKGIEEWEAGIESRLNNRFWIIGGGGSGVEVSLALKQRWRSKSVELGIVAGSSLSTTFETLLKEKGVILRRDSLVQKIHADHLELNSGEKLRYEGAVSCTGPEPIGLQQDGTSPRYIAVSDTLTSTEMASVFAVGDCAELDSLGLPKNGVYSVREGQILRDNLWAFFQERPLKPFKPQKRTLALFNVTDGRALARYGSWEGVSRFNRRLKEWIDRKWVRKFHELGKSPMPVDRAIPSMLCGGCGAKVAPAVLSSALARLRIERSPSILMGVKDGEDGSVHRPPEGKVEVQTVDFLKGFMNDPFLMGEIAAEHALSDLYAMNAIPFGAQAILAVPPMNAELQEDFIVQVLSGALVALEKSGACLLGGHTTQFDSIGVGFSLTGYADPANLFLKEHLKEGDSLILTKPLGSGVLLTSLERGLLSGACQVELFKQLRQSNRDASRLCSTYGVQAVTDVTGFGLLGHLAEMCRASGVSAEIRVSDIPVMPGVEDSFRSGIRSTVHAGNQTVLKDVEGRASIPEVLFDPQTSGGLLIGIRQGCAKGLLELLVSKGYRAALVGEVVPPRSKRIIVR